MRRNERLIQRTRNTTNALGMAISSRNPDPGTLIRSDQGTQFTSWGRHARAKASGLVP